MASEQSHPSPAPTRRDIADASALMWAERIGVIVVCQHKAGLPAYVGALR